VPKEGKLLYFSLSDNNKNATYLIPAKEDQFFVEAKFGAPVTLQALSFEDFFFILTGLLLESQIILLSTDIILLTKSM
jgi:hypothetical protein